MEENLYGSKEAANLIKVKESTLRKYALILEEVGYRFYKNSTGQRGFYDRDIIALRRMLEINQNPDMTLRRAAHAVVSGMADVIATLDDTGDITDNNRYIDCYLEEVKELKEAVKKQNELIQQQGTLIKELFTQLEQGQIGNQKHQELMLGKLDKLEQSKEVSMTKEIELKEINNEINDTLLIEKQRQPFWKRIFK